MRCIIIDDEVLALNLLQNYIAKIPFLELAGSFADPFEAMDFLMKNPVDLVFTDIEMNDINGVQLISSLSNRPMVVFISAYQEYAIECYSVDAIDYLLKPVPFERFLKAVNKAYEAYSQRESPRVNKEIPAAPPSAPVHDHIFVKTENRLVRILFSDILFVEGYGDYIKIHLRDNRVLLSLQNMGDFETKLPLNFIRVHRSYIVAIDKIEEIERKRIKMGKHLIPISESYQEAFLARINN